MVTENIINQAVESIFNQYHIDQQHQPAINPVAVAALIRDKIGCNYPCFPVEDYLTEIINAVKTRINNHA